MQGGLIPLAKPVQTGFKLSTFNMFSFQFGAHNSELIALILHFECFEASHHFFILNFLLTVEIKMRMVVYIPVSTHEMYD